jgi:uroporphyrinogen-III synthase
MASKPPVLVTRPGEQGGNLCTSLAALGFTAHSEPMLELVELGDPDSAQERLVLALADYQHIIFISANAVRYGMEWLQRRWPRWPAGLVFHAIGELTAQRLRECGAQDVLTGADMTSESLLNTPELRQVSGQRVLIVKGEGGRQKLRDQLSALGARVDELCCYRRRCPDLPPGALSAKLSKWDIGLILLSSGEGLANMLALLSPLETTKLGTMTLIVPSGRVADLAKENGFSNVETAANASDAAMLACVESWWRKRNQALENNE